VRASPEAAVRAAFDAFGAALDAGDVDEALAWCTDDVVFIGSGEGEEAVGHDAFPAMLAYTLIWNSIDIDVLGDVALVAAWGEAELVTSTRNDRMRYRLTGVLVQSGDRWLWRVHHGSEPTAW